MRDQTLGMIVATAIAAPVVVICCGGGLALIGTVLAGMAGWLSGASLLLTALLAIAAGGVLLALRYRSSRGISSDRNKHAGEYRS